MKKEESGKIAGGASSPPTTGGHGLFDGFLAVFWGQTQRLFWRQTLYAALILVTTVAVWGLLRDRVTADPVYQVGRRNIFILNPPKWVPPTFVAEVIAGRSELAGKKLNLTDPALPEELYRAFDAHPWVRSVESIVFQYPSRILVQLEFRRPVAIVEVPSEHYGKKYQGGVFQIDAEGVLLATDYLTASVEADPESVYHYLWISGIESTPMGAAGEPWNDPLLNEAALLAEFLADDFERLGIRKIHVRASNNPEALDGLFDLETVRGPKIYWGTFPVSGILAARGLSDGRERSSKLKEEVFAEERSKIDRLDELVKQYGSLDDLPNELTPFDLSDQ